ncbi:tyrosine-type recombinase/integrase [Enterococcus sp. LJL99]
MNFKHLFYADELNFLLFFSVSFFTGMRSGELLGITWEDIDFNRSEINVNKTLVKLKGHCIYNEPKTTAGKRRIVVNSKLIKDLRKWRNQQMILLEEQMLVKDWDKIQVFQRGSELLTKDHVRKNMKLFYEEILQLKKYEFMISDILMLHFLSIIMKIRI